MISVLLLAQLLLPSLAAQQVRSELSRYGAVRSASVSALPGIKLLWGDADSVHVSTGSLNIGLSEASELLWKARGASRIEMSAESMRLGDITMRSVRAEKHADAIAIEGRTANLQSGLPSGIEVQPLESVPGGVELRLSGNLLGLRAATDAVLGVQNGQLVLQPQASPFAAFVRLTFFSNPHVALLDFSLTHPAGSKGSSEYIIKLRAKLH